MSYFPSTTTNQLAFETDTKLAELHHEQDALTAKIQMHEGTLLSCANADFYYRARKRVTDMSVERAIELLEAYIETLPEDRREYGLLPKFDGRQNNGSSVGSAVRSLAEREALLAKRAAVREQCGELNDVFRKAGGWSRFFLVVSSAGHVHGSMHCSTCRPTTAYGWKPELSGKTEAEAVAAMGPALCSVCFPSAPVEMVGGRITKAAAAKLAA